MYVWQDSFPNQCISLIMYIRVSFVGTRVVRSLCKVVLFYAPKDAICSFVPDAKSRPSSNQPPLITYVSSYHYIPCSFFFIFTCIVVPNHRAPFTSLQQSKSQPASHKPSPHTPLRDGRSRILGRRSCGWLGRCSGGAHDCSGGRRGSGFGRGGAGDARAVRGPVGGGAVCSGGGLGREEDASLDVGGLRVQGRVDFGCGEGVGCEGLVAGCGRVDDADHACGLVSRGFLRCGQLGFGASCGIGSELGGAMLVCGKEKIEDKVLTGSAVASSGLRAVEPDGIGVVDGH